MTANALFDCSVVISRWFDRRRGLALGLIMFGMGVEAVVMPPTVQRLIAQFGWRVAFASIGCAILIIPIAVIILFLKEDPKQRDCCRTARGEHRMKRVPQEIKPGLHGRRFIV